MQPTSKVVVNSPRSKLSMAGTGHQMRILLADDQVWLRTALRLLFEHKTNFKVVGEAGSVQLLPTLVSRLRPDLLFLDWQLPGFDTNSVRQRMIALLRSRQPTLSIIALTNDDPNQNCLLLGANALINRAEAPLPERIMATVQQALCHGGLRSEIITTAYPLQTTHGNRKGLTWNMTW